MAAAALDISFSKSLNSWFGVAQFAGFQAAGKRDGLIAKLGLHAGEELGVFHAFLFGGLVIGIALLLPGRGDDLFFALGDFGLIALAAASAASAAPAASLLRLREFALEGIGLDKEHIRARFRTGVLGRGVDADNVARDELEVLEREGGRAVRLSWRPSASAG